jgi:hypothetical protein
MAVVLMNAITGSGADIRNIQVPSKIVERYRCYGMQLEVGLSPKSQIKLWMHLKESIINLKNQAYQIVLN